MVADGSIHSIEASGTLVCFPSIQADLVPTFKKSYWYQLLSTGTTGIIKDNKMILVKNTPPVTKLVDFFIKFSDQNNLIITSGLKKMVFIPLLSCLHYLRRTCLLIPVTLRICKRRFIILPCF